MADEHEADGQTEEAPAVKTPKGAWQALYDLGQETGWTFPHFSEWDRPDGVREDQLWDDEATDRRDQDLKVLEAQLSLLSRKDKQDKQVTTAYRDWARGEREICDRVIEVLSRVEWAYLDDLDVSRDGRLGEDRGFSGLDSLRKAARERAGFLLSVRSDTLSLNDLTARVQEPMHQYVNGLYHILRFPKDASAEANSANAQLNAATAAESAFDQVFKKSELLYTGEKAARVDGLSRGVEALPSDVGARLANAEGKLSQLDLEALGALADRVGSAIASMDEQYKQHAETFDTTLNGFQTRFAEQTKENQEEIARLRQEAMRRSVAEHAETFEEQADDNEKNSKTWFKRTCWLGGIAAGVTVLLFLPWTVGGLTIFDVSTDTRKLISDVMVRGAAISAVVALFQLARRMFYAQTHLAAVNRHRQRSLEAFDRFYEQASDEETKNAVLAAATRAIFEQTQTGFLGRAEAAKPASPIQDLVKLIMPKGAGESS
jgi:hypothetical protein